MAAAPDKNILSESAADDIFESPSVSVEENPEYDASANPLPGSSFDSRKLVQRVIKRLDGPKLVQRVIHPQMN